MILKNRESTILIDCIEYLSQSKSFVNMRKYIQHGHTDCLLHSIAVAHLSLSTADFFDLKLDKRSLVKGALLHDYFLYDWHIPIRSNRFHGFTHPKTALANAMREWELNDTEADIITKHMFPLIPALPRYKESVLVCIADKICSVSEILHLQHHIKVKHLYDGVIIKYDNKGVNHGNDN